MSTTVWTEIYLLPQQCSPSKAVLVESFTQPYPTRQLVCSSRLLVDIYSEMGTRERRS